MWYKTRGTILYDPPRPGMKRKAVDTGTERGIKYSIDWWCVIQVHDYDLARYYRWWVQSQKWIKLHPPAWGAHVSITRGEEPSDELKHFWKKHDQLEIELEYRHGVRNAGDKWCEEDGPRREGQSDFWFIDVRHPLIREIRDELGFESNWNSHMTVGRYLKEANVT